MSDLIAHALSYDIHVCLDRELPGAKLLTGLLYQPLIYTSYFNIYAVHAFNTYPLDATIAGLKTSQRHKQVRHDGRF